MKIFIIALLSLTLLTGCSWAQDLLVKTEPVERIPLVLPEPDRYFARHVKWVSITPENAAEIFADLSKKGLPIVVIGVTGEGYATLGLANGDKMLLIKQLKAQIAAYKTYYIAVEKRDDDLQVVE